MRNLKKQAQAGFTLIELLIVLTIVTIIAIVVANNIEESLATARDVERRSDINSIQTALESYWHENQSYPADINVLNITNQEILFDPSGNLIQVLPASDSVNKPASSYQASQPSETESEDEQDDSTETRPATEYTYAAYDCQVETLTETESEDTEEAEETGEESDQEPGDDQAADHNHADDLSEEETALEVCQKYVLYSWLETAEPAEIPYEQNNLHDN